MKKCIFILVLFFIGISNILAKDTVKLSKCVDGDTAKFNLNNEIITVRFLAINTPESTNKIEKYGKEASKYTCNLLSSAKEIELEYDSNSSNKDKYGRTLAWIWIDNVLIQEKIIENGYGEVAYLYGDYKYTTLLEEKEENARQNKLVIWSDYSSNDNTNYIYIFGAFTICILYFIFNKKYRNKVKRKIIKKAENKIKDLL